MRGLDVLTSMAFMTRDNNFWKTEIRGRGVLSLTHDTVQGAWCQLDCNSVRGFLVGEDSDISSADLKLNERQARAAMAQLGAEWKPVVPRIVQRSLGWTFAFAIDGREGAWMPLVRGVTGEQLLDSWWMNKIVDQRFDASMYCRQDLGVNDINFADDIARLFPIATESGRNRVPERYKRIFMSIARRVGYPIIES
jgi:hypothetical protein